MSERGDGDRPEGGDPRCPICGKPQMGEYRPFCSKRCADIDLGRWLNGRYAIPVQADADEDGEKADDRSETTAPDESDGR